MTRTCFVLKGNLCQTVTAKALDLHEQAYAVCVDGVSKGVFVAHCPASNMNLTSGIAPIPSPLPWPSEWSEPCIWAWMRNASPPNLWRADKFG